MNIKNPLYFGIIIFCLGLCIAGRLDAAFPNIFDSSEIPLYPSFEKTGEESFVINGIGIRTIRAKGPSVNVSQVADYYKGILAQRSWDVVSDDPSGDGSVSLSFKNGDGRIASVNIFPGFAFGKPGTVFLLMRYSLDSIDRWFTRASDTDNEMPGLDIPWLRRYPQSIRINSVGQAGTMSVTYTVPDYGCLECVVDFYKEQMMQKGWRLISTNYNTKEEMEKYWSFETIAKNILEKIPERFKEEFGDGYLKKMEESMQYNSYFIPDETKSMHFRKGRDICSVSISYDDLRGGKKGFFGVLDSKLSPEQKEFYWKTMRDVGLTNRMAYLTNVQYMSKEAVTININYMQGKKLQKRQAQ
ncbi:GSKIP domain-containing protein [Thermoproteota archaeon]